MPLQILTLKLDGITSGDYLTWCRDPEPPALHFGLRSISIDADSLGNTITGILDWNESPPSAPTAASAAGLPLTMGVQIEPVVFDGSHAGPPTTGIGPHLTRAGAAPVQAADIDAKQRLPRQALPEGQLCTAA
jgi:hypothetical protein